MPYRNTQFRSGESYHVYNRGNNHQTIFFERQNYLFFLRQMRKYLLNDKVEVVSYCLMPNHYHMLLYLNIDDPSALMQPFILSYTKAINKHYNRVGSLFQGRFKAIHIDRDEYLLHLSRYIHLNPVAAGLVRKSEDWEYSSYLEFIGLRNGAIPRPEVVLTQFLSHDDYRIFVESYTESDRKVIDHLTID